MLPFHVFLLLRTCVNLKNQTTFHNCVLRAFQIWIQWTFGVPNGDSERGKRIKPKEVKPCLKDSKFTQNR